MKKKFRFLPFALFLILSSCGSDNSYTLNGNIDIEDGTNIYILQADQNNQPYIKDSTSVKSQIQLCMRVGHPMPTVQALIQRLPE